MEKNVKMPKLRPEMERGVLCAWLKEEGDTVAAGEPLFEIETNKVVNQVEATVSGVLKKLASPAVLVVIAGVLGLCARRMLPKKQGGEGK